MEIQKLENGQFAIVDVVEYLTIEGIEQRIEARKEEIKTIEALIDSDKDLIKKLNKIDA